MDTITFDNFSPASHATHAKHAEFDIKNVDIAFVNSIRRIILTDIPNVAISFDPYITENSDIVFKTNTSGLHNEYLGHRISLLPVHLTSEEIENYDPENPIKFKINVKNTGFEILDVTTNDIVIEQRGVKLDTQRVFPLHPITNDAILITKLKPNLYSNNIGEELNVEMTIRMGTAQTHSRWSPVSTCTYFNIINEEAADAAYQKALSELPPNSNKESFKNQFDNLDKQRYFYTNKYNEANRFRFIIESECHLSPYYLFDKAIKILKEKVNSLVTNDKKYIVNLLNNTVANDDEDNGDTDINKIYIVVIENEDHTLGNFLQSMIFNMLHREQKMVDYIGYFKPHPLQNDIVFKIKLSETNSMFTNIKEMFEYVVPKIIAYIDNISNIYNNSIPSQGEPPKRATGIRKKVVKK